jgi:chromosome segregation ATPase
MTLNEFLTKAGQLFGLVEKNLNAEQQLATVQADNATLKTSLSQKDSEIATQKETIKNQDAEIQTLKAENASLKGQVVAKDNEVTAVKGELKTAQEKLANPSAQVISIASQKAAEITAAQGQPPVKVPTVENPAAAGKQANNLIGLAKVQAAFKAELEKQKA